MLIFNAKTWNFISLYFPLKYANESRFEKEHTNRLKSFDLLTVCNIGVGLTELKVPQKLKKKEQIDWMFLPKTLDVWNIDAFIGCLFYLFWTKQFYKEKLLLKFEKNRK